MEIKIDLLPSALDDFSRLNPSYRHNPKTRNPHREILDHFRSMWEFADVYTRLSDVPAGKKPLIYVSIDSGLIKAYPYWGSDSEYSGKYFKSRIPTEIRVSPPERTHINWIARHLSEDLPKK